MSRRSERHFFTSSNDLKLAAILEHPEATSRGVILFSHCFTCSKDLKTIVKLSRRLAELGWTNCRYDFRGIGQSEGIFSESNFSTNLEDLISAAKWLSSIDLTPHFLFGHSFGGAASLAVASDLPVAVQQHLSGIITLAAPCDTAHLADILLSMNPQIANGEGEVQIGGKSFLINAKMLENFRSIDFNLKLEKIRQTLEVSYLLLHSLADQTVAYYNAQKLFKVLTETPNRGQCADVSLYTMKQSDHLLAENPGDIEFVAALLDNWCQQRLDG